MKRVATAAVLIAVVVLAVFRAPWWLLSIILGIVALLAAKEYLDLAQGYGITPFRKVTLLAVALAFFPIDWPAPQQFVPIGIGLMINFGLTCLLLLLSLARENLASALPGVAYSVVVVPYIALPLSMLGGMLYLEFGSLLLLYGLVVVWVGDIAAYYVGRNLGRHSMAPRISPKKTWEGAVASVAGSVIVGTLLLTQVESVYRFLVTVHLLSPASVMELIPKMQPVSALRAALCSAGINVAAQLGDLVESAMKRGANVKDSGTLLPGHGGVLDRIDALLFAAPVLWYYAAFRVIHF